MRPKRKKFRRKSLIYQFGENLRSELKILFEYTFEKINKNAVAILGSEKGSRLNKLRVLDIAQSIGLNIPKTLITNRKKVQALVDSNKLYSLKEAAELVKKATTCKFNASVDLHVRLGIDPRKADQAIRGTTALPHGTGRDKKVLVLCTPDKEDEARKAGADYVGLDEYVDKISAGWIDLGFLGGGVGLWVGGFNGDDFSGCGVDDADVQVVNDHDDVGSGVGSSDADVVESPVVAQG